MGNRGNIDKISNISETRKNLPNEILYSLYPYTPYPPISRAPAGEGEIISSLHNIRYSTKISGLLQ